MAVLKIDDLRVSFLTPYGENTVLNGISFTIEEKEIFAIIGESGCGKSVTAQTILRLIPQPPSRICGGSISLCGTEITHLSDKEMQGVRGRSAAIIFQDPMSSLNPTRKIGYQVTETLYTGKKCSHRDRMALAVKQLEAVKITDASLRARQYPHELSGGMQQRVMIAMALAASPRLLIADEPTTALDVTTQLHILELIKKLREEKGTSVLFISHDIGVVAGIADRIAVMYAGRIVEIGTAHQVLTAPLHPYTKALIESRLCLDQNNKKLSVIPGSPPRIGEPIKGCAFAPRCRYCSDLCETCPSMFESDGHMAACHLLWDGKGGSIDG